MEFHVADIFEAVVDNIPNREALVLGSTRLTFSELDKRSNQVAAMLKSVGIKKEDHIGIYAFNCIEWIETMIGAFKIGAVPININYRYVEEELNYLVDNADIKGIVYQKHFGKILNKIKNRTKKLKYYIAIDDASTKYEDNLQAHDYAKVIKDYSSERVKYNRTADDRYVIYTGGTTGMPKGVIWRQEDVIMTLGGGIDHLTGEKFLSPEAMSKKCLSDPIVALALAPLMHGAAQWQTFNSFFSGWKLIFNNQKSFDADYIWSLISKEKVQNLTITGDAMGRPLADALKNVLMKGLNLDSLIILTSTAAVFSSSIKDQFLELLPNLMIIDGVGSSETGSTGFNIYSKGSKKKDSGGGPSFARPKHSVILDPETKKPLDEKDTSTIGYLARSGNVPIGYYKDLEKSLSTFIKVDGEKYSIPGDFAKFETDGQITLLGRGSVSINSGGEKIFPEEVEAALKSYPEVFDCLVVGKQDSKWGQKVVAVIQSRNNNKIDVNLLKNHCKTYIANYKFPKEFFYQKEIKRAPSGKPDYSWAQKIASS
jgi:3-oxocholest-4-en-26-oate---CoA ligase